MREARCTSSLILNDLVGCLSSLPLSLLFPLSPSLSPLSLSLLSPLSLPLSLPRLTCPLFSQLPANFPWMVHVMKYLGRRSKQGDAYELLQKTAISLVKARRESSERHHTVLLSSPLFHDWHSYMLALNPGFTSSFSSLFHTVSDESWKGSLGSRLATCACTVCFSAQQGLFCEYSKIEFVY